MRARLLNFQNRILLFTLRTQPVFVAIGCSNSTKKKPKVVPSAFARPAMPNTSSPTPNSISTNAATSFSEFVGAASNHLSSPLESRSTLRAMTFAGSMLALSVVSARALASMSIGNWSSPTTKRSLKKKPVCNRDLRHPRTATDSEDLKVARPPETSPPPRKAPRG